MFSIFVCSELFSLNNIKYIKQIYDTKIIILENDEKTLNHRHKERKDSQSDKFLKGRKTKINNISNHFEEIEVYSLQNLNESINLSDKIIKFFQ